METKTHTYRLEAGSENGAWAKMKIYLSLASYDENGTQTGLSSSEFPGGEPGKPSTLETQTPAAYVTISIYAVPETYPVSSSVGDSPEFKMTYRVFRDDQTIADTDIPVNPWGGVQLIGIKFQ